MANVELVRQSLISCLHGAIPAHTPEGYPSVLGPDARGGLWAEATLPYNLRLADTVGPLAVVYRESLRHTSELTSSTNTRRYRSISPMCQYP